MTDSSNTENPRVIGVSGNASISHKWPPGVAADELKRGEISANIDVEMKCACGNDVLLGTIQRTVRCQECGTEWRLR